MDEGANCEESAVGDHVPGVRGGPRDGSADCPSDPGRLCQGGPAPAPGRLPCGENGEEWVREQTVKIIRMLRCGDPLPGAGLRVCVLDTPSGGVVLDRVISRPNILWCVIPFVIVLHVS
jgi:hypothetical protein